MMWRNCRTIRHTDNANIVIKNLDKSLRSVDLHSLFSAFGTIIRCKVATNERGASKGYGFVHFDSEDSANMSIDKVNGMMWANKKVCIEKFIPHREREKELDKVKFFTNLYVKNFDEDFDDDRLKELFEPFGKITSHKVMTKENGKGKGFGFVAFKTNKSAEAALLALNGKELDGKILYVGWAQRKIERQNELLRRNELRPKMVWIRPNSDSWDAR